MIEGMLRKILLGSASDPQTNPQCPSIGKVCMIRTYSAGVHFGKLESKNGNEVTLLASRRVYSWVGAATLSQLSAEGSKRVGDCKITMQIPIIHLLGVIEIIEMSNEAIKNLSSVEWKIENE